MPSDEEFQKLLDRYFPVDPGAPSQDEPDHEQSISSDDILRFDSFLDIVQASSKDAPEHETQEQEVLRIQQLIHQYLETFGNLMSPAASFPKDLATLLADAMEHVVSGYTPVLFQPPRKRPGERSPPNIEAAKRHAVKYIVFCRNGLIQDATHNKTIQELYGVSPRLVRMWITEYATEVEDEIPQPNSAGCALFGGYDETVNVAIWHTQTFLPQHATTYRASKNPR